MKRNNRIFFRVLIINLIVFILVFLSQCSVPQSPSDGQETIIQEEDQGTSDSTGDGQETVIQELDGGIELLIDSPVPVDVKVVEDTSSLPYGAKVPVINLEGDFPEGEEITISFGADGGFAAYDQLAYLDENGEWQKVPSTVEGNKITASIDRFGMWTVVPTYVYTTGIKYTVDYGVKYWVDDGSGNIQEYSANIQAHYPDILESFIFNDHIYLLGSYTNPDTGEDVYCYWIDDGSGNVKEIQLNIQDKLELELTDIFVDSGYVYISGCYSNSVTGEWVASYWVDDGNGNTQEVILDSSMSLFANSIYVFNGTVYVAGESSGNACYWVNDVGSNNPTKTDLETSSSCAKSIYVDSDGSIYISGKYSDQINGSYVICYWKDGTRHDLKSLNTNYIKPGAISVSEGCVYVSGRYYDDTSGNYIISYWKDDGSSTTEIELISGDISVGRFGNHSLLVIGGYVYVVTYYYDQNGVEILHYWKVDDSSNNVILDEVLHNPDFGELSSPSVLLKTGGVYIIGSYIDYNPNACIYIDDGSNIQEIIITDSEASWIEPCDIFVENGIVYISGYYEDSNTEESVACYWIYDNQGNLTKNILGSDKDANADSIYIENGTIYVSGELSNPSTQEANAYLWIVEGDNIKQVVLESNTQSNANSIFVENGIVYVAGSYETETAQISCYWVYDGSNVQKVTLCDTSTESSAEAISAGNGSVYVVGGYYDSVKDCWIPCLWFDNGSGNIQEIPLSQGDVYSEAFDAFLFNDILYISGVEEDTQGYDCGVFWIFDGYSIEKIFIESNHISSGFTSVFVKDAKIFIGGFFQDNFLDIEFKGCYWIADSTANIKIERSLSDSAYIDLDYNFSIFVAP